MTNAKLSDLLQTCSVKYSHQCSLDKAEGDIYVSTSLWASAGGASPMEGCEMRLSSTVRHAGRNGRH